MADIALLRKIGKITNFEKSQMLFMQNDPGDNMYIVLRGTFGVYINSFTDFPMRVAVIPIGKFFGEMSVIDGWPRSATIISEDESTALAIEKGNFGLLLESNPEMARSILKTLNERVESTAEQARQAGKTVPDLPEHLQNPEPQDSKTNHDNMIMLAQRIRELNDLLLVKGASAPLEKNPASGLATLLPPGHKTFGTVDQTDNSKLLSGRKYVCPYCGNTFNGKIPLFARLKENGKTLDQRITYTNFNILLYTNIICPNCNYCDTYLEFSSRPSDTDILTLEGNQFKNTEGFTGFADDIKHSVDEAILSYYLNLACLKQMSNSGLRQGKAWQRLHWLYKDIGDIDHAEAAAWESRRYYKEYAKKNDGKIGTADHLIINAILGELSVAVGEVDVGREYFMENAKSGRLIHHELVNLSLKRASELKYCL